MFYKAVAGPVMERWPVFHVPIRALTRSSLNIIHGVSDIVHNFSWLIRGMEKNYKSFMSQLSFL